MYILFLQLLSNQTGHKVLSYKYWNKKSWDFYHWYSSYRSSSEESQWRSSHGSWTETQRTSAFPLETVRKTTSSLKDPLFLFEFIIFFFFAFCLVSLKSTTLASTEHWLISGLFFSFNLNFLRKQTKNNLCVILLI